MLFEHDNELKVMRKQRTCNLSVRLSLYVLLLDLGSESTFLGYAIACIIVVVGFFALNFFYIRKLPPPIIQDGYNTQEASYLAPHGVPGSGLSHSASQSRFDTTKGGIKCANFKGK